MTPPTITQALADVVQRRGDGLAVRTRDDATRWTWSELSDRAHRAASGLRERGVGPGDTVGLLLDNRPEFFVCDLACVLLGAVPVSIYSTYAPGQIEHLADDAGFALLITQESLAASPREAQTACDVITIEDELDALCAGEPVADPHEAKPDDLVTIIYTSGTTGPPKGVELRHAELIFAMTAIGELNHLGEGERVLCWLPMAHIAERNASYYGAILYGAEVTTVPDAREIGDALREVHPTWFFAVPRIWEKLKAGIEKSLEAMDAEQRELMQNAVARALERVWLLQEEKDVPEELESAVAEADPIFGRLREAVGLDQLKAGNVGAAPCAPEVIAFFHALGVPLGEIYGQSEGCACATCNPPEKIKIGSVGPAVPGVEVKLGEDGEVLVRGENLMRGYRGMEQETADSFDDDGFLRTGDIGELDDDGYLTIVDRKKELIINAGGKNMSPANIEAAIKTHTPLIAQIVAIGDRRPFNVALVSLDPDALGDRDASSDEVRAEVEKAVEEGNRQLARVEQIKRFTVLSEPWAPGGDELTPTMKLKRKPIAEKYADQIDELYA